MRHRTADFECDRSLVPRPHPQKEEKGLVNLGRILGPSLATRLWGYVIGMHLGIQLMASRIIGMHLGIQLYFFRSHVESGGGWPKFVLSVAN